MKEFDHPHVAKLVGEPFVGEADGKQDENSCFPKVGERL